MAFSFASFLPTFVQETTSEVQWNRLLLVPYECSLPVTVWSSKLIFSDTQTRKVGINYKYFSLCYFLPDNYLVIQKTQQLNSWFYLFIKYNLAWLCIFSAVFSGQFLCNCHPSILCPPTHSFVAACFPVWSQPPCCKKCSSSLFDCHNL